MLRLDEFLDDTRICALILHVTCRVSQLECVDRRADGAVMKTPDKEINRCWTSSMLVPTGGEELQVGLQRFACCTEAICIPPYSEFLTVESVQSCEGSSLYI